MNTDLPITDTLVLPAAELSVAYARSGGPGGQRVNKVSTKVQLRWAFADSKVLDSASKRRLREANGGRITNANELLIECSVHANRTRNLATAREHLARLVRASRIRPKTRKKTRPSRGSVERRLKAKKVNSQKKANRRSDY
jgi:ribosome-associated protein